MDRVEPGQRVLAFDKVGWFLAGKPENKQDFWKPATVRKVLPGHHLVPVVVTLHWDDQPGKSTSHGHYPEDLKPLKT